MILQTMQAVYTRARNLLTQQRALQTRTNMLSTRLNAMQSRLNARQALQRSQFTRQQRTAPPQYTFKGPSPLHYDPTKYGSNNLSQSSSSGFTQYPNTSYYSQRSLNLGQPKATSTPMTARRIKTPASENIYDSIKNGTYDGLQTIVKPPLPPRTMRNRYTTGNSSVSSTKVLTNRNMYDSIDGQHKIIKPPLPPLPKNTPRLKRLANWAKKHKTALIITGAGVTLPAIGGGITQAVSDHRQDVRDAEMHKQTAALMQQEPTPFTYSGGGGGGGGSMRAARKWFSPKPVELKTNKTKSIINNKKKKTKKSIVKKRKSNKQKLVVEKNRQKK